MDEISVKLYSPHAGEIRRFPVQVPTGGSGTAAYVGIYSSIMGKVKKLFPDATKLQLVWKDDEGDVITMNTDDEVAEALRSRRDLFRIFVHFADKPMNARTDGTAEGQEAINEHIGDDCAPVEIPQRKDQAEEKEKFYAHQENTDQNQQQNNERCNSGAHQAEQQRAQEIPGVQFLRDIGQAVAVLSGYGIVLNFDLKYEGQRSKVAAPTANKENKETEEAHHDEQKEEKKQDTAALSAKQPLETVASTQAAEKTETNVQEMVVQNQLDDIISTETDETEKFFKEVRDVLNNRPHETVSELLEEFWKISQRMNTKERVEGVVDIVFQAAVDEPHLCRMYSMLCIGIMKRRAHSQLGATRTASTSVNWGSFLRMLLSKCQTEFEKGEKGVTIRKEREAAIQAAETPEKKQQLQKELDEYLLKEKHRMLCTILFICELYLYKGLTAKIMRTYIDSLLRKSAEDEISVVCLWTIMTMICEPESELVQHIYQTLEQLKRSPGLSRRSRFMIISLLRLKNVGAQHRQKLLNSFVEYLENPDTWKSEGPETVDT